MNTFNFTRLTFVLVIIFMAFQSCMKNDPNKDESGTDVLVSHEIENLPSKKELSYSKIFYVPIYSDIYVSTSSPNSLLAATLSIKNTSLSDSLFVTKIDYYNTAGDLVRAYLDNVIALRPMETIEYVIEREDETGGSGANFVVKLGAKTDRINPLIEAVMIGYEGNKTFAFTTSGHEIFE